MSEEKFSKVLGKVLNFLAVQERTKKEIGDRIDRVFRKDSDTSPEEIATIKDRVFEYLKYDNLIDDLKYAKTFVSQQINSKNPKSRLQMIKFLSQKGVARAFIDEAITIAGQDSEIASAKKYAEKKLRTLKDKNSLKTKKKLQAYLASKGYSAEVIFSALSEQSPTPLA